ARRAIAVHSPMEVDTLERNYLRLTTDLAGVRSDLEERTSRAQNSATEAIGQSRRLSKTVESAQKLLDQETRTVSRRTNELALELDKQARLLLQIREAMRKDLPGMTRCMLSPTVQLSGEETVGSGTLFACVEREGKKTGWDTYVLTAYHVVRNILADEPGLARKGIECLIYISDTKISRRADVLVSNPDRDVSLLKLRGGDRVEHPARLASPESIARISIWTPVYAIGCPLGNDPIPTSGFVTSLDNQVNGTKYWMINAPTYYGNSGGGIYNGDTQELIAVFSKIYTHGRTRPTVIPHMGLAVPLSLVYPWLEAEGYEFLVPGRAETTASEDEPASPQK
ncbi:MAG: serine protease, partial [Planctomycetota bacterium]